MKVDFLRSYEIVRDALGVSVWACIGVITRYWLEDMSRFVGFPGFTDLWANLIGTAIMGFAISHRNFLSLSPPTSVGITTGLCGSITTFSSWQVQNAEILVDWTDEYSTWHNILISFTNQIVGVTACLSILLFGRHLAGLSPKNDDKVKITVGARARIEFAVYFVTLVATFAVVLSLGFATDLDRLSLLFSVFFAPFGAVIRWGMGLWLNHPEKFGKYYLPYGTMIVNIMGVLLLGMKEIVVQDNDCWSDTNDGNGKLKAAIAAGHGTGFCGCLTTVSTFIVELHNLPTHKAYIYGIVTIVLAQGLLIALLGTYRWTQNPWEKC